MVCFDPSKSHDYLLAHNPPELTYARHRDRPIEQWRGMVLNRFRELYQLRGRVGRSDEQAYAHLLIPKDKALSQNAGKRLKVLMEYLQKNSQSV